ncbi:MAG: alanine racemase [SAR324 cluster bacterium]|nr:alanine racemase [SAR324 cluster bacterium]MBL7035156.1 alanine racemase [SAR324 cluster bacterium]
MRPTFIEVSLENLRHNLQLIQKHTENRPVMAVVKSNAYGHGLIRVAKFYEELAVDCLGVALLEEGILLRKSGISLPIVVFGGVLTNQISEYLKWNLEFFLSSSENIRELERICEACEQQAVVHLKLDSGMGRVGCIAEDSAGFIEKAVFSKHIFVKGVCSHLACADDPEDPMTVEQLERFLDAVSVFERLGVRVPIRHLANSGGVLYFPQTHLDLVRPGILLYGVYPEPDSPHLLDVRPALQLKSQVSFHKSVPNGFTVSYGATWTSTKRAEIATVPLGYGDGYRRAFSNRGEVLIGGKRQAIVGRVCMDQFMVKSKNVRSEAGTEVLLIGEQDGQSITVEEMSAWAETIPYEILTNLNERIPRIYTNK